jgi:signal peptidase II
MLLKKISHSGLSWLWLTLVVIAIDRTSKIWIVNHFNLYDTQSVLPFFNLTLVHNKGAAFSFLNEASGWQTWFFGGLALTISFVLLIWMKRISYTQRSLAIALALIIGGALGNLWDRISYGYVIDFLDFYINHWHWPVFNVADSAVCIGATLLAVDACLRPKSPS